MELNDKEKQTLKRLLNDEIEQTKELINDADEQDKCELIKFVETLESIYEKI